MRQDVKLGVVISAVLVFVAGGYYMTRDSAESTISIGATPGRLADSAGEESTGANTQPAIPPQEPAARKVDTVRGDRFADLDSDLADTAAGADVPTRAPSSTRMAMQPVGHSSSDAREASRRPTEQASRAATAPTSASRDDSLLADRSTNKARSDVAGTSGLERPVDTLLPSSTPALAHSRTANEIRPTAPRRSVPLIGVSRPAGGAAVETHRVQPGDTFSQLAVRYYGSAGFTQFLIGANPQAGDPNRLAIGTIISIPPRPAPTESATARASNQPGRTSSSRTYTVRSGDSFYAIARDVLGDASRWRELYELNKKLVGGDPKSLQVGHVLQLPGP